MENQIKVVLAPGVDFIGTKPVFTIHSFKELFKGKKQGDMSKINVLSRRLGEFTMRPFERLLVGTGVSISLPKDKVLQISSRADLTLQSGLILMNTSIKSDYTDEICLILFNTTQYLIKIKEGDIIAEGTFLDEAQAEFSYSLA